MNRQLKKAETHSSNLNGVHNDGNLATDPLVLLNVDRQYSL